VVRHGFRSSWTVDHVTGTYTSYLRSPTGLPTDPALTSHGVQQADELAKHLLDLTPPIDQVYSSPYYRCLQTISPFVSQRNARQSKASSSNDNVRCTQLDVRVESGLSEWYGRAHFEHPTSAPLNNLSTLFPDLDANYVSLPAPPRRGESIPQLYERVAACIQDIISLCDQQGKKAVLISTHAAVVIALGRVLTANVPEDPSVDDFGAFTCGLSTYRRQGIGQDSSLTAATDRAATASNRSRRHGDTQDARQGLDMQPVLRSSPLGCVASIPLEPGGSESEDPFQKSSLCLSSRWRCEVDSDCSFLRGGEERGWKFSGDESFVEVDPERLPLSAQESDPKSAVASNGGSSSGAAVSKL
jgi:transcription factor C subunit 7